MRLIASAHIPSARITDAGRPVRRMRGGGWFKRTVQGCLFALLWPVTAMAQSDPGRVVVVANAEDADSLAIARHYLDARSIPQNNLITLALPTDETISWNTFVTDFYNPLKRRLIEDGWMRGTLSGGTDLEGRLDAVVIRHDIDYLVLCRVPLRIDNDPERLERAPQKPPQEQFQVNQAAVDSELALLPARNTPTAGFVPNPLFNQRQPEENRRRAVLRVARLDGPSREAVTGMIDSALAGERDGVRGRAYIDLGGPHERGDGWIQQAGEQLEALHYPTTWQREKGLIGWDQRLDAPAFYFGWWTANVNGPFARGDFRFPPGAVAFHLHSFSATTIRRDNQRWVGPLVARGVAATVGNVFEPYLELTFRPDMLMQRLAEGAEFGEAAYHALPSLSWMGIVVGDPLYRPFTRTLSSQVNALAKDNNARLDQYVVLRQMQALQAEQDADRAFHWGQAQFHNAPGIALAYALAVELARRGETRRAVSRLDFMNSLNRYDSNLQGLAFEILGFLHNLGANREAFTIARHLLDDSRPARAAKITWLPRAIEVARAADEMDAVHRWTAEYNSLQSN